jgi:hypothetical protein
MLTAPRDLGTDRENGSSIYASVTCPHHRWRPRPRRPLIADAPRPPAQALDLRPRLREFALRPHERAVVGRRDRLRTLDDRDVLAHRQHGSTASTSAWTSSSTASAID